MSIYVVIFVALFFLWRKKRRDAAAKTRNLRQAETTQLLNTLDGFARRGDALAAAKPPAERVFESSSIVLRRQIPPRDEAPRSWLGGMPMLPAGVEWPRGVNPEKKGEGEVPLHFIAQICCEDLPKDLWGGLGPRTGWLRLFYNGNSSESDNRGLWRFVYSEELGSERLPPSDIGMLHDGVYTGSSDWTKSHVAYPRWPVDLVAVPNTLRHEGQRSWPTLDDFEQVLYPGADVQGDRHKLQNLPPFSRRAMRDGLRSMIATLSSKLPDKATADDQRARFADPANFELVKTAPAQTVEFAENRFAERAAEQRGVEKLEDAERAALLDAAPHIQKFRRERAAQQALLDSSPTPEALIARVEQDLIAFGNWRDEMAAWLGQWLTSLDGGEIDTPLTGTDLENLQRLEATPVHRRWVIRHERTADRAQHYVGLAEVEFSLAEIASTAWSNSGRDTLLEYYLDPARRSLLPAEHLPAFEAHWRSLYDNRPHRIGGYHDGVQSDAVEGPQERLLLMQLATDDAMRFCWGDAGALYAMIKPEDLVARRFDAADFWLECH